MTLNQLTSIHLVPKLHASSVQTADSTKEAVLRLLPDNMREQVGVAV